MTPSARIGAAIAILDLIQTNDKKPADSLLADWARDNRYAGSKDRNAIATMVYGVLRHRAQLDWWCHRSATDANNRMRLIAWLLLNDGHDLTGLNDLFTGERFAPSPLSPRELRAVIELSGNSMDKSCQPVSVKVNIPEWIAPEFESLFGDDMERQLKAMNEEAPVDVRANRLKTSRDEVQALMQTEGIETEKSSLAPNGLRLAKRRPLSGTSVFKDGLIEVQDEGSQLVAALCDVKPGMKVVDFCAGAGGKSLALAADMENKGRIIACDVSEFRLKRAAQRLKRAGAFTVERRTLTSARDKWVKRSHGRGQGYDRVLIDAPCSGTGTWRRNPDQKWRLKAEDLQELALLQKEIIDSSSRLVAPGGRLIYVTCSLLARENEAIVDAFLTENDQFFIMPIGDIWKDVLGGRAPADTDMMRLTPADMKTDGFFIAVMGRKY